MPSDRAPSDARFERPPGRPPGQPVGSAFGARMTGCMPPRGAFAVFDRRRPRVTAARIATGRAAAARITAACALRLPSSSYRRGQLVVGAGGFGSAGRIHSCGRRAERLVFRRGRPRRTRRTTGAGGWSTVARIRYSSPRPQRGVKRGRTPPEGRSWSEKSGGVGLSQGVYPQVPSALTGLLPCSGWERV